MSVTASPARVTASAAAATNDRAAGNSRNSVVWLKNTRRGPAMITRYPATHCDLLLQLPSLQAPRSHARDHRVLGRQKPIAQRRPARAALDVVAGSRTIQSQNDGTR